MLQSFCKLDYQSPEDRPAKKPLFEGLAVAEDSAFCEAHLGRHPVVWLLLGQMCSGDLAGLARLEPREAFEAAVFMLVRILEDAAKEAFRLEIEPELSKSCRRALKRLAWAP